MSPAPPAEAPARLLVIDGDAFARRRVEQVLRQDGHQVELAADAATGWHKACCAPGPDLILLDGMLPDGDGLALCRRLRADSVTAEVPVLLLAAADGGAQARAGLAAGAVDVVAKPAEPALLRARVRTHTRLARLSRGLAAALAERTAEWEQANRRLREVNLELTLIQERERRRLAEGLHDSTIQQLVLARILLDADLAPGRPPPAEADRCARDRRLLELLDLSLRQLRSLVFELDPPVLYQAGLYPALLWLADDLTERWGLPITCALEGSPGTLSPTLTLVLFHGARELLTNVAKHAGAKEAKVLLRWDADAVELTVSDDGHGFRDAAGERSPAGRTGFGLSNLRARVELLGGRLHLSSSRDGTRARLWLPIGAADDRTSACG